jgi:seryl-tRNA synthetase
MHDIRWIRDNPQDFDAGLRRRGLEPLADEVLALDKARRAALTEAQALQEERNKASKDIGAAKARGEDASAAIAKVSATKAAHEAAEAKARDEGAKLDELLAGIPNLPAADVPDGPDETANVEIRRWGEKPEFAFAPKEHFELGETLGLMDFEAAAKLSGARFVVLKGALARLERAIAAFMLDLHTTEFGYAEVSPPVLIRDDALFGTGQLPKFGEDLFRALSMDRERRQQIIDEEVKKIASPNDTRADTLSKVYDTLNRLEDEGRIFDPFWLIPTAEVPLTNLVAGDILDPEALPRRYTAHTACFRAEAGAAGKDTRGMLRQHQFYKVELVSITTPDQSETEHERMTNCAEEVLKRLGLHYRTVVLSTGDMGFSARKTYDIEVWLPGQGAYREISSCSNCGDFQARRMNARFRAHQGKKGGEKGTQFVHTLNGSGLAVGRTLIAILETYQQPDGSVVIPEALRPYMGGLEAIAADG